MWPTRNRHNPESFGRLREHVIDAFTTAGAASREAEQSWYVFDLGVAQWLGTAETDLNLGTSRPRFDLYLDTLARLASAQAS